MSLIDRGVGGTLRSALDAARDELRQEIARGAGGRVALERHAARVDGLLQQLYVDAGAPDGPVAVIALGGYGRRHLCLHSDIDLLVLFGGQVGDVEESLGAGRQAGGETVVDFVYLPSVHPEVVGALTGTRQAEPVDSLGVIETTSVASTILAADAGVKGAAVHLVEIRLGDGLGGKGIVLYSGLVADVETAVEIGVGVLRRPEHLLRRVVIPQLHPEMWTNVSASTRFRERVVEAR